MLVFCHSIEKSQMERKMKKKMRSAKVAMCVTGRHQSIVLDIQSTRVALAINIHRVSSYVSTTGMTHKTK